MINSPQYEALVDEIIYLERTPSFYAFVRIFTELTQETQ